jgi:hypothetical protein
MAHYRHWLPWDAIEANTVGRKAETGSLAGCFSPHQAAAKLTTEDLVLLRQGDGSAQSDGPAPLGTVKIAKG